MTDTLSQVFGCIKLHKGSLNVKKQTLKKKGSRNTFFFVRLRKLSRLRGQLFSAALVIDTFMSNIALY